MASRRRPAREPRCYDKVLDEVAVGDDFHARLLRQFISGTRADLVWMAYLSGEDYDSPMVRQALQAVGDRVRSGILLALADEVGCEQLWSLSSRFKQEECWEELGEHVSSCCVCMAFCETSDAVRDLRSKALAEVFQALMWRGHEDELSYRPRTGWVIEPRATGARGEGRGQ